MTAVRVKEAVQKIPEFIAKNSYADRLRYLGGRNATGLTHNDAVRGI
jgi:hypothetical protein